MPFQAVATAQFARNPAQFLANNYVRTFNMFFLTKTIDCVGGVVPRNHPFNDRRGTEPLATMGRNNQDLKTVTAIGANVTASCYVGLNDAGPNSYTAEVQNAQDATHPLRIAYLPAAANQIVCIRLPTLAMEPFVNIMLTDPVSGCTVFITHSPADNQRFIYHANALAVDPGLNDDGRIYMRDMLRGFIAGTAQVPTHMFDQPFYNARRDTFQAHWTARKQALGRVAATITHTLKDISVIGIRTGANWDAHYQCATTIDSVRTGPVALFKGGQSHKFKIEFEPLPAVLPGGVPFP